MGKARAGTVYGYTNVDWSFHLSVIESWDDSKNPDIYGKSEAETWLRAVSLNIELIGAQFRPLCHHTYLNAWICRRGEATSRELWSFLILGMSKGETGLNGTGHGHL